MVSIPPAQLCSWLDLGVLTCPHRRPDRMCTAVGIYGGIKRICNWCLCLRVGEICSAALPVPHALLSHLSVSVLEWLIVTLVSNRASYWSICQSGDQSPELVTSMITWDIISVFPSFFLLIVFCSNNKAYLSHTLMLTHTHTNTLQFIDVITWI